MILYTKGNHLSFTAEMNKKCVTLLKKRSMFNIIALDYITYVNARVTCIAQS